MESTIEQVRAYYDENAQKEWGRLERHPFEFIFTTYMMEKYVRPGSHILDIGGGPGRYALYFAEQGCDVTLIDLSEGNIRLAKQKAAERGLSLNARVMNCLNLDDLLPGMYDHVFLMGPLYHLTQEDDRRRAVELALRRLKPGGIFYCSFIMDFAGIIYDLKNGPGLLPMDLGNRDTCRLIDSIVTGTRYEGPAFTTACFMNQRQIEPFLQPFGLQKLHLFGQEGVLAPHEDRVLTYPQEEIDLWVETAKRFLELPELLSWSEHAMYIGRKPA